MDEAVDTARELGRRRALLLRFARSPVDYLASLVVASCADVRKAGGIGSGRGRDDASAGGEWTAGRPSSFFRKPWVEPASVLLLHTLHTERARRKRRSDARAAGRDDDDSDGEGEDTARRLGLRWRGGRYDPDPV